jgi:hypothetical protein
MTRAERRHYRRCAIAHRVWIIKQVWHDPELVGNSRAYWYNTGRLAKYNLACGCSLCKGERYRDQRAATKKAMRRWELDKR